MKTRVTEQLGSACTSHRAESEGALMFAGNGVRILERTTPPMPLEAIRWTEEGVVA